MISLVYAELCFSARDFKGLSKFFGNSLSGVIERSTFSSSFNFLITDCFREMCRSCVTAFSLTCYVCY